MASEHGRGMRFILVGGTGSALTFASHILRRDARAEIVVIEADAWRGDLIARGAFAEILLRDVPGAARYIRDGGSATDASSPRLLRALGSNRTRLHRVRGLCTRIEPTRRGVVAHLADGTSHLGLAAAYAAASATAPPIPRRRRYALVPPLARARALRMDATDIPFGTGIAYLAHWLRRTIHDATARGLSWAEVVDGLRLHAPEIWRHLPPPAKATFLRHGRDAWDRVMEVDPFMPPPGGAEPARHRRPEGAGYAHGLHPADLLPYRITPGLIDLDVACAALAERILLAHQSVLVRPVPSEIGSIRTPAITEIRPSWAGAQI